MTGHHAITTNDWNGDITLYGGDDRDHPEGEYDSVNPDCWTDDFEHASFCAGATGRVYEAQFTGRIVETKGRLPFSELAERYGEDVLIGRTVPTDTDETIYEYFIYSDEPPIEIIDDHDPDCMAIDWSCEYELFMKLSDWIVVLTTARSAAATPMRTPPKRKPTACRKRRTYTPPHSKSRNGGANKSSWVTGHPQRQPLGSRSSSTADRHHRQAKERPCQRKHRPGSRSAPDRSK